MERLNQEERARDQEDKMHSHTCETGPSVSREKSDISGCICKRSEDGTKQC